MKFTTYASAAVIALTMSIGSASADQFSVMKDLPGSEASAATEMQFPIMNDVRSAVPMTAEQLGETVGEGNGCRRHWFHGFRRGRRIETFHGCIN